MQNIFLDEIYTHENHKTAEGCKRFFKTQKGEYAYGDMFLGVPAPILRKIAKKYYNTLSLKDLNNALKNKYHELRACALMVLILQYQKSREVRKRKQIFELYLANTDYINNWDLVDISAANIVGNYLFNDNQENSQQILYKLANTEHLWSQRIAIVATHYFIKQKQYDITFELSKKFFTHQHDLMHKAVGWMLREIGKQDISALRSYLNKYSECMPRTTLRYAIEKFDKEERKKFLSVKYKNLS